MNLSLDILTPEAWSLSQEQRINGLVLAVILTVFLVIGVPINLAVILSILRKRLYSQPTFILLLNLSVTDFLFCFCVHAICSMYVISDDIATHQPPRYHDS